jgi:hypothetical protein
MPKSFRNDWWWANQRGSFKKTLTVERKAIFFGIPPMYQWLAKRTYSLNMAIAAFSPPNVANLESFPKKKKPVVEFKTVFNFAKKSKHKESPKKQRKGLPMSFEGHLRFCPLSLVKI